MLGKSQCIRKTTTENAHFLREYGKLCLSQYTQNHMAERKYISLTNMVLNPRAPVFCFIAEVATKRSAS